MNQTQAAIEYLKAPSQSIGGVSFITDNRPPIKKAAKSKSLKDFLKEKGKK